MRKGNLTRQQAIEAATMFKYHVWGSNKPSFRTFVNGKYEYVQTARYSGHEIVGTIEEAQKLLQDYLRRGWDVNLVVEEV